LATGTATLNFGAFPGATDTSVAVTEQDSIASDSYVEAWVSPATTVEHTADEHWVESLRVVAGNIQAGTGFTIYGRTDDKTRLYGRFNIGWVWV
jgi:hypothetical protein